MMRTLYRALLVGGLLAVPGVSQATGDDHNGYAEIMQGNLAGAERMLVSEHKMFPEDADLALNLAAIYVRTGRAQQARSLYLDVLAQPNQNMAMPQDRSAWSHDLATLGLKRLDATAITAR